MHETRAFGKAPITVQTGAAVLPAGLNNGGIWHLVALTDTVISVVAFAWPSTELPPVTALTLPAGQQLPGIRAATITSGTYFAIRIF